MTDTELHALGFTRQSKTMWRKGDVTYQNGKFYRQGKEMNYFNLISFGEPCKGVNGIVTLKDGTKIDARNSFYRRESISWAEEELWLGSQRIGVIASIDPHEAEEGKEK